MARGKTADPAGGFPIDQRGDRGHLVLEGIVGAARAQALLAAARELADARRPVTIDLSGLRHVDCAGIQVLLALDETLRQQGQSLVLESVSESVSTTFRNAGLGRLV
jgi:anti-anti-sigma factor